MTKFILPALLGALLLPFASVEAKTYGGFKPGKKFTFKVTEVISEETNLLTGQTKKVSVPAGIPKYKKGKKVKFKIVKKGAIKAASGLNVPFSSDGGTSNSYFANDKKNPGNSDSVTVHKTIAHKPTGVSMQFTRINVMKHTQVVVWYTLD